MRDFRRGKRRTLDGLGTDDKARGASGSCADAGDAKRDEHRHAKHDIDAAERFTAGICNGRRTIEVFNVSFVDPIRLRALCALYILFVEIRY
jgi:hypothetical protein